MKMRRGVAQMVVVLVCALLPAVICRQEEHGRRVAKQIHTKATVVDSDNDHNTAETGFGAAGISGHGKYFQYQHNPEHDHYEFGYRRGNEHHFQERYEKAAPHAGHFKTKARWGDKHGGYGEHYWDYNHAGHGHDDDGGDDGSEGGYSEPVPEYRVTAKRQSPVDQSVKSDDRVKRQQQNQSGAEAPRLVFDVATGHVIDEVSGQAFVLQPVP